MLDFDLADLYEVETKRLNEQVKRNKARFPEDFMFRLSKQKWEGLRSQNATASNEMDAMGTENATASRKKRNVSAAQYAFTEHGVTMPASVLRSQKAVKMSIAVVRAFIALKQFAMQQKGLPEQLREIYERLSEHDVQLNQIYDVIESLLDEKSEQKTWENRERIGFKK